jgi:hypothetical protein
MGDYLQSRERAKREGWAAWSEGIGLEPVQRRTRSGLRHDDGPIPADVAGRIVRERAALSYIIFMIGAGAAIAAAVQWVMP